MIATLQLVREAKQYMVFREAKMHLNTREPKTTGMFSGKKYKSFEEVGDEVMSLLRKEQTPVVYASLCEHLYPVWDYYINFYLYKFRIFDGHEERSELYQQLYLKCLEMLRRVKHEGNDFNRIKRYFNKSIYG